MMMRRMGWMKIICLERVRCGTGNGSVRPTARLSRLRRPARGYLEVSAQGVMNLLRGAQVFTTFRPSSLALKAFGLESRSMAVKR